MPKVTKTKIFKRAVFLLFTVLFVFVIALSWLPKIFGLIPCSIASDSMEPAIGKGSYVLVRPIEFEDIKTSDILLFEVPKTGERFARRIVDIYEEKKQFVTSGDANDECDPMTTSYSCVLGKVIFSVPMIGYPSLFLDSLTGKIFIMLFYIVWIAIEIEIYRSKKGGHPNE